MTFLFIMLCAFLNADVFYNLDVEIKPDKNFIKVDAKAVFDKKRKSVYFYLDKNIVLNNATPSFRVEVYKENLNRYMAYVKKGGDFKEFRMVYTNVFKYPFIANDDYARGMKYTYGLISRDGCFLNSDSAWYPVVIDERVLGFNVKITIPKEYDVVMPGVVYKKEVFGDYKVIEYRSDAPVYDIPLVCGMWKEYVSKGEPDVYVYLKTEDDRLAEKYIDYSKMYIKMYSDMIGRYPYKKFAVVENFWETGYAFPSFTLLGPSVIKFPFIFVSSLPHEILHNWWGNGVYPDYSKGNWSEGLTTYLSDYLLAEQRGKGKDYRVSVLKKYSDYVEDDIPLSEFKERHSNKTEAVGYGKSMMFFHMLRKKIADDRRFIESLRRIYSKNKFTKISWKEIKDEFEKVYDKKLDDFFDIFISSKYLCNVSIIKESLNVDSNTLSFELDGGCSVEIPVEIFYSDGKKDTYWIKPNSSKNIVSFKVNGSVLGLCLDCNFNILRKLSYDEVPVTFSKILSKSPIVVVSEYDFSSLKPPFLKKSSYSSNNVFYAGKENFNEQNFPYITFTTSTFIINGKIYDLNDNYVFFVIEDSDSVKGYAFCDERCDLFLNKIIHYGKYSYIITDNSYNVIETGVWNLKERRNMIGLNNNESFSSSLDKPLWSMYSFFSLDNLKKDSYFLSSILKTRHPGSKEIEKASRYIEKEFKKAGLQPFFNSYRQDFDAEISSQIFRLSNICAKTSQSDKYVLVSAHYDHLFPQKGVYYPGANDNASGVAVMLELARYANRKKMKGLVFCAFSGEEWSFKGSEYFASVSSSIIKAVVNIDTVGRVENGKIIVIDHNTSNGWKQILRRASLSSGFDFVYGSIGLTSSDQVSFIKRNIPSIQLYDGNIEDYHKPTDTFDKLDFKGMISVAEFAISVIEELIDKEIDFQKTQLKSVSKRNVSLGFAPDFSYSGVGIKIKKINPSSPLSLLSIKEGDIITAINNTVIKDIYDYMDILSQIDIHKPILIDCLCGGEKKRFSFDYR